MIVNGRMVVVSISFSLLVVSCLWQENGWSGESPVGLSPNRQQTEQDLSKNGRAASNSIGAGNKHDRSMYPTEQYLIGTGQGDFNKGKIVCQRVAELSARSDLAKQIRVLVKEHMVDRIRDRAGREAEQDTELTREEIVQEYLQGVKIVDHQIDEDSKICSATAVMPKSQIHPAPASDRLEPTPTVVR